MERNALIVQMRNAGTIAEAVIGRKDLFFRSMERFIEATGERDCLVAPMTEEPPHPVESTGLPNLVYKYPGMDRGLGVHFMVARDVGHARDMALEIDRETGLVGGYFQPFLAPGGWGISLPGHHPCA